MGFNQSRDTKVFRDMEFFWLTKILVSLLMDNKEERKVENLEIIIRLEAKFIVLCIVAFGINFKVQNLDLDKMSNLSM
jgi:hypothetical protein